MCIRKANVINGNNLENHWTKSGWRKNGKEGIQLQKLYMDEDLILRPFAEKDAEEFFSLIIRSKPYLRVWLDWLDQIQTAEDTLKTIQKRLDEMAEHGGYPLSYAITYKGKIAGTIGFNHINQAERTGTIGYWLGETYQGKGIMTKAFETIVSYGFKELELTKIIVTAAVENYKSRSIPERCGFTVEGILREEEWLYDHYVDHVKYSLSAEVWNHHER